MEGNDTLKGQGEDSRTNIPNMSTADEVFELRHGQLFQDSSGYWCALGWLPVGQYSIAVRDAFQTGERLATGVDLRVGRIETISIADESGSALTQLNFPEGFIDRDGFALYVLDAEGELLVFPGAFNEAFDLARTQGDPPCLPLPMGVRFLSAYGIPQNGEVEFCTAVIPSGPEFPAAVSMQILQTRVELDLKGIATVDATYLLQSRRSETSNQGGAGMQAYLFGMKDRCVLHGLPPGEYVLERLPTIDLELGPAADADAETRPELLEFRVD
jgi:hypothetical protein